MLTAISTVSAHSNLIKTLPAMDEVVRSSPQELVLAFSEIVEVETVTLSLYDSQGKPVSISPPALVKGDASQIFAELPPLANGSYTVVWSVLSEDGHPVSGNYIFSVGERSAEVVTPSTKKTSPALHSLLVGLRFLAETLIVTGGGFFLVRRLVPKKGNLTDLHVSSRVATFVWFFLLFCLFAEGFIYTSTLAGGNIDLLFQSPFIMMILVQFFLLIAIVIPGMGENWYSSVWLLLIGSLAFGGHAWGIEPVRASLLLRLLHVLSISLWVGTLLFFLLSFYRKGNDRQSNTLFSMRPFFLQLLLIVSIISVGSGFLMGSLQTDWLQVMKNGSLWAVLLKNKLILVVVMLLLALIQTIRWRKNEKSLARGLIALEFSVGVAVILLGVWMSQTNYSL